MKNQFNRKKGILFWITGYSGSGKTTISNQLKNFVKKKFGNTIVLSGDDFRKNFKFNNYDKESRIIIGKQYTNFLSILLNQKINVIFSVVGLYKKIRKYNLENIENYIEIFIETEIKDIKKKTKKNHYKKKYKNILGIDLKAELPEKPNIKVKNDFKMSTKMITEKIINELQNYEYKK